MSDQQVKRIKPYPIVIQLTGSAGVVSGKILKVVLMGFIADLGQSVLTVMDTYDVIFELPVLHHTIHTQAKVVKTYDRINPENHHIDRLAEFHFLHLGDPDRNAIYGFTRTIRQID